MKILVIQLARLGDIYQSWPTLRAIKRNHPQAEVDFVVRSNFKEAAIACESADNIIELNTREFISPCFSEENSEIVFQDCIDQMDQFLDKLQPHYDQIINLSYSPFSSYLNFILKDHSQDIRGYSRFKDGYLSLLDEASAYFFAQVGPDKSNRIHLTDVFAATAGLVLEKIDFRAPDTIQFEAPQEQRAIVIHVGASEKQKTCPPHIWAKIINELCKIWPGTIQLIGSAEESLEDQFEFGPQVVDLCGKTNLNEVFQLIHASQGLIACDSMAIQVANLCQIPVVNLSHTSVSFWETGPRMASSRILKFSNPDRIQASEVACLVEEMMNGTYLFQNTFCLTDSYDHEAVVGPIKAKEKFQWDFTKALYFEADFPVVEKMPTYKALHRIAELAQLGLEQTDYIRAGKNSQVAASILAHIDELMESIARIDKSISPLVRWFNTEKSRIGPGPLIQVVNQTEKLFQTLAQICQHYVVVKPVNVEPAAIEPADVLSMKEL